MRRICIYISLSVLVSGLLPAFVGFQEEALFTEAKLLIFDKKWREAQAKLEEIISEHAESRIYPQALFYLGKCLAEQRGEETRALQTYKRYIGLKNADRNLVEEAESSIIDLASRLYEQGERRYLREIEERLESRSKVIRYYAAYQLSFSKDRRAARKALPVLEEILEREDDEELRDRVRLAILRIDPHAFEEYQEESWKSGPRYLCIRVEKEGQRKPSLSLNIPWALADLAFSAIPQEEKAVLRKEGYDLDRIIKQLLELKGEILELYDEEGGTTIKLWIK